MKHAYFTLDDPKGRWRIIALRGLSAMVFGLLTLLSPRITAFVLTIWFAAYMALDGILALSCGCDEMMHHRHGTALLLEGVAGLAVAAIVLTWPGLGLASFVLLAACWAILTGAALLWGAIFVPFPGGKASLAGAAVLSVLLGACLLAYPLTLVLWLGGYLLVSGSFMLAAALKLRSVARWETLEM